MGQAMIKVLLLGEHESGSAHLRHQLESRGCVCWFAHSAEEGAVLHGGRSFHLILSTRPLHHGDAPALAELSNSSCSIFYTYPVEDGCWWMPVMRHGEKCVGCPGATPGEFLGLLEQVLSEIRMGSASVDHESETQARHSPHAA
jgi:hypothetical protein